MNNQRNILIGAITLVVVTFVIYKLIPNARMKPVSVKGSFKGDNCDELHAFESTHGKMIGGMNTKVKAMLEQLYSEGYNPEVTEVKINMHPEIMTVDWEVIISDSKDGKAWVGFTSRGASGSDAFFRASAKSVKQDPDSLLNNVKSSFNEPTAELKKVLDFKKNIDPNGKAIGKCATRQIFYNYTKPNKYPKH